MITVSHLSKKFRTFERSEGMLGALKDLFHRKYRWASAVDDISFHVQRGEMVGLIGPNGAGKSTTIKMLTGILCPSSGSIEVAGFKPFEQRMHYVRDIGVVFGQRSQLWWDLAVIESLKLLRKIYNVPQADFDRRMLVFKDVLGLGDYLHKPVRKLSLGERMRCDLAASLLHNPKVLFLDEPTIGLDLIAKDAIRKFLKQINKTEHTTVILTTHDLSDIEELCERIMIIDHGKLIFDGGLEDLKTRLGGEVTVAARLNNAVDVGNTPLGVNGAQIMQSDPHSIAVSFSPAKLSNGEVMKRLFDRFDVREVRIEEPNIEDVIRRIYQQGHSA